MLELKDISLRYDGLDQWLYKGFHISFERGCYALIGRSGCGKSSLLRMMDDVPCVKGEHRGGTVSLNGEKLRIGSDSIMVFQDYPLYYWLNVEKNAKFGLKSEDDGKWIDDLAQRLDVKDHYKKRCGPFAGQISGGQQQRVAILQALSFKPQVLLLDEPTSALDEHNTRVLARILLEYGAEHTVICVTHDDVFLQELGAKQINLGEEQIRIRA